MRADFLIVLDACVLLPMPLADTLLRMAETPRLYIPKWSNETLEEITRNLTGKWGKSPEQAKHREDVMRQYFPEACVTGYKKLIPAMTNQEKDRHVLASAVRCGAKVVVTSNLKDFPEESTTPYDIECQGPSTFLINLYDLEPGIVAQKLTEQAQDIDISLSDLLLRLRMNVPSFVAFFCEEQKIQLP